MYWASGVERFMVPAPPPSSGSLPFRTPVAALNGAGVYRHRKLLCEFNESALKSWCLLSIYRRKFCMAIAIAGVGPTMAMLWSSGYQGVPVWQLEEKVGQDRSTRVSRRIHISIPAIFSSSSSDSCSNCSSLLKLTASTCVFSGE